MSDLDDLIDNLVDCAYDDGYEKLNGPSERLMQAITAIRTHLAAEQPKQEPVRCNPAAMRTAASSPAVLFITELDSPEDEALRRDAERYRWMKQEVKRIPPGWDLVGWDAAIDAAMENKR